MELIKDAMSKMTNLRQDIKWKDEQNAFMSKVIDKQNVMIDNMTQDMHSLEKKRQELVNDNAINIEKLTDENELLRRKFRDNELKAKNLKNELDNVCAKYNDYVKCVEKSNEQTNDELKSLQNDYNNMNNNYLQTRAQYETNANQLKETIESHQLMINALRKENGNYKTEMMFIANDNKQLKEANVNLDQKLKQTEHTNVINARKYEQLKQKYEELELIKNDMSEKVKQQSVEMKQIKIKFENDMKCKVNSKKEEKSVKYYKDENEKNKRRLLAFKVDNVSQQKLIKSNPTLIGDAHHKILTEHMKAFKNEVISLFDDRLHQMESESSNTIKRVMSDTEQEIHTNRKRAKRLVHKLKDGRVLCALCDNIYNDAGNMQRHLNMKHKIVLNDNFDDVEFDPKLIPETSKYEELIID